MNFDFNLEINTNSCICSRFDRFNIFFPLWLQNAINYKIDIIIFLDKYDFNNELINYVDSFKKINSDVSVSIINISNAGNINKINNVQFFTELFKRLYKIGYKNIIYTDPDELLITKDLEWYLSQKLDYCFTQGFEIVQNLKENEKDYISSLKFLDQRNYGVWCHVGLEKDVASYCKLVLFRNKFKPKSSGRHATEYKEFKTIWKKIEKPFEIYTIHLREMDVKTMVENTKKSIELYSTCRCVLNFKNENVAKERIDKWFTPNLILIPNDIREIILKHNL